ncbi:unnamed protein product [Linum trigynum]|uniref:Polygalacturonase n=1 Tax=Linum trigynum TaxID=586398 RepID=A0AAV2D4Q5_9ROSI
MLIYNKSNIFDVTSYGAVGDGKTEASQGFLKAWADVCGKENAIPTLLIPANQTFLLNPVVFNGRNCKSNAIHVQLQGTILAPDNVEAWDDKRGGNWLRFSDVFGLIIDGGGRIDGRGEIWWRLFRALLFHNCSNLQLSGVHHVNSQKNHISLNGCNNVQLSHLTITGPEDSPNTDGVDVCYSTNVQIRSSFIATGDDCIAINGFSSFINISEIACGPGHGISVGSLGKGGAYETVEEVHVRNCTFYRTRNGARIKTWQGGRGYARKISYEDIILIDTRNPIIITHEYMNHHLLPADPTAAPPPPSSSDVEIRDVWFRRVNGTSSVGRAINFDCGGAAGCTGVHLEDVHIVSSPTVIPPVEAVFAECNNAHGDSVSTTPPVGCLLP